MSNDNPILQAKWITFEEQVDSEKRYPATIFRKTFTLKETSGIFLSITAHGLYRAKINHQDITEAKLEPGPSEYSKNMTYRTYDVSAFVKEDENVLEVTVGDGWYRGGNGIESERNLFGTDCSLLCALYNQEGSVICLSDESWQVSQGGPIRLSDTAQGEIYAATMEDNDCYWDAIVLDFDNSNLTECHTPFVKEHEHFIGKRIETPNGEIVYDFGQNLAGYTHFILNAHQDDTIMIYHGETLDENGNFTQSNYEPGKRNKNGGIPQRISYLCKEGLNDYAPSFSIFGFRYIKVETEIDLSEATFEAIAVYSDMAETGSFECSDERINQLVKNSLWSMKSNFCHIPTDCPTRERAGWTGDAGLFVNASAFLMDSYEVYRNWLKECRLLQGEDGKVANIAPRNGKGGFITDFMNGSAGWGDAVVHCPYELYRIYGKKEILEENFDMMNKWVQFSLKRAGKVSLADRLKKNPYEQYIVRDGFHFGEWNEPDINSVNALKKSDGKRKASLATQYLYRNTNELAQICTILGKEQQAKEYGDMALKIKEAWQQTMLKDGEIQTNRQADYVRPLAFGLLEKGDAKTAAKELNRLVKETDDHLNTGFLSTPYLCDVLCQYGYKDTAYRLLLQNTNPSWLYAVEHGAATIWECWDGVKEDGTVHDSLNHYSYGAICDWLYGGVCGIRLNNHELTVQPQISRQLNYAKAIWKSPVGTIESGWEIKDGQVELRIVVPEEVQKCKLILNGKERELQKGNNVILLPMSVTASENQ